MAGTEHTTKRPKAEPVRLQRVMADAGVGARRACERLIEAGRVQVNGTTVRDLPVFVDPHADRIMVDGRELPKPERHIYVMLNKPPRTVTTLADEPGMDRRTVADLVEHPSGARLFPVGRLDYETTGLVLMTNDGELANRLTHPRYGIHKTYRALIKGYLNEDALAELERGIYLAERKAGRSVGKATRTARVELELVSRDRDRTVVELTLREGRNRQVRRMLASVNCPVKKLTRTGMGPLRLKGLALGEWRELTRAEITTLKNAANPDRHGRSPDEPETRRARPGPRRDPRRGRTDSRQSSSRNDRSRGAMGGTRGGGGGRRGGGRGGGGGGRGGAR